MDASHSSAIGSCHFICSADPTQSLEDVVPKCTSKPTPYLVLLGTIWYNLESSNVLFSFFCGSCLSSPNIMIWRWKGWWCWFYGCKFPLFGWSWWFGIIWLLPRVGGWWVGGGGEGKLLGNEIHGALLQARVLLGWGLGLAILFAVPTLHSPWKMLCSYNDFLSQPPYCWVTWGLPMCSFLLFSR